MKEYLYKKKYSLLNTGSIHLTNPENMLKYIDLKVNELVNENDKGTRLGIKLKILNEFYEILKYDLENSEIPIPFGYFENSKEEKEFQNNKIKANTVVYYLGNICLNYHTKLIGSNLINRIPIVSNSYNVKFDEIYVRALNEYIETLKGEKYKGVIPEPQRQEIEEKILTIEEWRGGIPIIKEETLNDKYKCIKNEHAYGTAFILPTLIERFLMIQIDGKIMYYLLDKLTEQINKEKIILTEEEKSYYNFFIVKGEKTIFASETYVRRKLYDMFLKYNIVEKNDKDIKLVFLKKFGEEKNGKRIHKTLTLGGIIRSNYVKSLIKKPYVKLLNTLFNTNEMNIRNNIAHANNENTDYLCLAITAIMMQLLWDICTGDIFI